MAGGNDPAGGPGEIDNEIEDEIEDVDGPDAGEDLEGSDLDGGADGREDGQGADDEAQGQARDVGRQGRPGRDTIKLLRQRAQQAEERAARQEQDFSRRLAEIEQRQPRPDPAAAAREEAEELARVELMSPVQVAQYYSEKSERKFAQALQGMQFQTQDRIDKQSFEALVAQDPLLSRVAPKVETLLQQERAAGRNTDRLVVAKYLLGDEVLSRRQAAGSRQSKAAARRIVGQTTRPANGAGDGARPTGRQGDDSYEAAMRRLRGQTL